MINPLLSEQIKIESFYAQLSLALRELNYSSFDANDSIEVYKEKLLQIIGRNINSVRSIYPINIDMLSDEDREAIEYYENAIASDQTKSIISMVTLENGNLVLRVPLFDREGLQLAEFMYFEVPNIEFTDTDLNQLQACADNVMGKLYEYDNIINQSRRNAEIAYNAKVEEFHQYLREIATMLSHQIKTPLANINTASYLAGRVAESAKIDPELLAKIKRKLDEVSGYSSNINAKIEATTKFLNLLAQSGENFARQVKFSEFVSSLTEAVNNTYFVKQESNTESVENKIQIDVDSNLPSDGSVIMDSAGIINAIKYLLDNAIDFTKDKEPNDVHLKISADENNLIISVEDNGIGIAEDKIMKVTEPFQMEEGHGKQKRHGTGLGIGLTSAKLIVEQNHGTINLQSVKGEGTKVTIKIPR